MKFVIVSGMKGSWNFFFFQLGFVCVTVCMEINCSVANVQVN